MKSLFSILRVITILSLFFIFFTNGKTALAESISLFKLYRTNYFPEKTYLYSLEYDKENCRIISRNPISVYFISTADGSPLSGFSGKNKEYFSAKNINSADAQSLTFSFKAINELESMMKKKLDLRVQLTQNNNSCEVSTDFISGSKIAMKRIKQINVEFNLINMPPFGQQPDSIKWLKLIGSSNQICLIGSCI